MLQSQALVIYHIGEELRKLAECIISGRQGLKGDTGPTGPQGTRGPTGPSGSVSLSFRTLNLSSGNPYSYTLASNEFAIRGAVGFGPGTTISKNTNPYYIWSV